MTEEEKAEKYANKKAIENNMPADSEVIQYMAKAYLAGLHEGQPQLTEAKEIIRELVDRLSGFAGHHFLIVDKAEAFLKE